MRILALDTSCDETCAAIVDTTRPALLADVVYTHALAMQRYGGVVPEIASREHSRTLPSVVREALVQARLEFPDLDVVAVTNRPGLIGALMVGVSYAKALAFSLGKPWIGLNHIEGHLFSPWLAELEQKRGPEFPALVLVVSGGHTELFWARDYLDYQWLGGTLDDAAGEAFDKIGKLLGLPYPAGPAMDRLVRERATDTDRERFAFPTAKTEGLHFSFSGLKTAVHTQLKKLGPLSESDQLALAASAQEAILDALTGKIEQATNTLSPRSIVITGGVACNSRLREKLPHAFFPPPRHCSDNAAMIAWLAVLHERTGRLKGSPWTETAIPNLPDWRSCAE